jgi:pimeloyl-ACP methyl ester carboxylesterase
MDKHFDINEQGFSIRCKLITSKGDKSARAFDHVAIVTHGFGSSKETAGTASFGEHLTSKYKGWAVIAFDWPCHGMDARKKLSIAECLTYLTIVADYAKRELKAKDVFNYSTSLGGYLTLRYLIEVGNPFQRIALRCPAIRLYETMAARVPEADKVKLRRGKEIQMGFARKLKVDQAFFEDLKAFSPLDHEYFDFADRMLILHGTADDTIPIEDARTFAENNVIEFVPVEGVNHPFQNPDHMALAIHKIIEFFHAGALA